MSRRETTIERLLKRGLLAIDGAVMSEEIHPLLAELGYDRARLLEGKELLDKAERLVMQQRQAQSEKSEAVVSFRGAWESANTAYRKHLKVARVALKRQPEQWMGLGLAGARAEGFGGWLAQARQFYTNALESQSAQPALGRFNLTREKLAEGLRLIEELERVAVQREREEGEAQQLTIARDDALDELDDWLDDFLAIAPIALEEQPQWLEKLGLVAA